MEVPTLLWCQQWDWQPLRVSFSSMQWCKLKHTYHMDTLQSFRHMHNNTSNTIFAKLQWFASVLGTLCVVNLHINCMCRLKTKNYDHLISTHAMFVNDFLIQISNLLAQNVWMVRMGLFLKRRLSLGNGSIFKESFRLPFYWFLVRKIAHVHAVKSVLMLFSSFVQGWSSRDQMSLANIWLGFHLQLCSGSACSVG